jgi:hypothetical protein
MDRVCSTNGEKKNAYRKLVDWWESQKERDL